jgi:hypothetical protein
MRRKIVTYFLLCVLAIQLLPVKEIGMLLYNNQLTEEIYDALDTSEEKNDSKETKKEFDAVHCTKNIDILSFKFERGRHAIIKTILISRLHDDTLTPPPLG